MVRELLCTDVMCGKTISSGPDAGLFEGGGLEIKKIAREIFLATPFLITLFPSLLTRGYYSFRRTGMGRLLLEGGY